MQPELNSISALLAAGFSLVFCLAYSIQEMEVPCSSKASADFHWNLQHYVTEDISLHSH
jgi:hypothetical protein